MAMCFLVSIECTRPTLDDDALEDAYYQGFFHVNDDSQAVRDALKHTEPIRAKDRATIVRIVLSRQMSKEG